MTPTPATNTASGAADLLDLIEAYAEARHRQGHSSYNEQTATALQAVKDALAAGQATAAQADSVLEDAARLDWLEQNLFHREKDEWDTKFGGYKEYNMWVLFSPKGIQGRARDIIDAARKQGETQ